MKRGKSSFINALLGAEVLPTGVLPVTAIITEISYGHAPEATIVYARGGLRESVPLDTLADYITEAGNPGNRKDVASVGIPYPTSFLESGIVLIDTPGIGSTRAHNTRTTESYLEHVDAGIVVLSVDPPITEVESQFLRRIKEDIPKLFFILNKTDIASEDESSKITEFLRNELNRLQMWAGKAGDPFWIEPDVLHAVGHAFQDGTTVNLNGWDPSKARNLFAGQTVYSMVLEVPDDELLASPDTE